jgi:hypothetical protein
MDSLRGAHNPPLSIFVLHGAIKELVSEILVIGANL